MGSTGAERGRELERRMAAYFEAHGYVCERNVVLRGRSGAPHEFDVIAQKSDGITTFRLAVECKAWKAPIEKDAITKFDYTLRDVGINKGIVVSHGGLRSGARTAAEQLGIEVWDEKDLADR